MSGSPITRLLPRSAAVSDVGFDGSGVEVRGPFVEFGLGRVAVCFPGGQSVSNHADREAGLVTLASQHPDEPAQPRIWVAALVT